MNKDKLGIIALLIGIIADSLAIGVAITQPNPALGWVALGVVISAFVWYLAKGLRGPSIIIGLGLLAVIAIGLALWLGPVTVNVTVYIDQNGNGIRESNEPGVGAGMEVKLTDRNGITRF